MSWVTDEQWFQAEPDPMIPYANDIIEHMNDDHAEAIDHYLALLGAPGQGAQMLAVDPWGAWLWHEERLRRLPFPARAEDAGQVRDTLVMLARTPPEDFFLARP